MFILKLSILFLLGGSIFLFLKLYSEDETLEREKKIYLYISFLNILIFLSATKGLCYEYLKIFLEKSEKNKYGYLFPYYYYKNTKNQLLIKVLDFWGHREKWKDLIRNLQLAKEQAFMHWIRWRASNMIFLHFPRRPDAITSSRSQLAIFLLNKGPFEEVPSYVQTLSLY